MIKKKCLKKEDTCFLFLWPIYHWTTSWTSRPSRTVQTDQEMSDKVAKTVLLMQSRDKSWSSSTERERENISLDFPWIWTYCQLKRIFTFLWTSTHNSLSLSLKQTHTDTQTTWICRHSTRCDHKYFRSHHSYLFTQQKGENKERAHVQHVTSPASSTAISWNFNKHKWSKHTNVCSYQPTKLKMVMHVIEQWDGAVSPHFKGTLSSGYGKSLQST